MARTDNKNSPSMVYDERRSLEKKKELLNDGFECENCGKKTDGSYIDCRRYYCDNTCAQEGFIKRMNLN